MTRDELISKWETECETMRRRGVLLQGALLCEELLRDVRTVFAGDSDALLTLREASARSGYSVDHIGRLLREGALHNAGRKGSPRIRAGELPRKPPRGVGSRGAYDPVADAESLAQRRRRPT